MIWECKAARELSIRESIKGKKEVSKFNMASDSVTDKETG